MASLSRISSLVSAFRVPATGPQLPARELEPAFQQVVKALQANVELVLLGKPDVVRLTLVGLLSNGHILIEDIPGVGKTVLAGALARSISCPFNRIQCTADLLPADITGLNVLDREKNEFVFKPGPIFANIVLVDELNRCAPRTQSAFLEAMSDFQVTVDGVTRPVPQPFMVIATQNPMEHSGIYPLPESQLDRFLLRFSVGYPDTAHEMQMLQMRQNGNPIVDIQSVINSQHHVMALIRRTREIFVEQSIVDYLLKIVAATRCHPELTLGVSPRGSLSLFRAAQAIALLRGRGYVIPDDVQDMAIPVLAHRIEPRTARSNGATRGLAETIIGNILSTVPVPC